MQEVTVCAQTADRRCNNSSGRTRSKLLGSGEEGKWCFSFQCPNVMQEETHGLFKITVVSTETSHTVEAKTDNPETPNKYITSQAWLCTGVVWASIQPRKFTAISVYLWLFNDAASTFSYVQDNRIMKWTVRRRKWTSNNSC